MSLYIVNGDITKIDCDAIVNAANKSLRGGGGVDNAIHKAAGKELNKYCKTLHGCSVGEAKISPSFNMNNCKYIIHTVGPFWINGRHKEREKLQSCYLQSLNLAKLNGCKSLAFPLISSGAYRFPKAEAINIAIATINMFLSQEPSMEVYIVLFNDYYCRNCGNVFSVKKKVCKKCGWNIMLDC